MNSINPPPVRLSLLATGLLLSLGGVAQAAPFTLIDLGTLGGASSAAYGVNNSGQVVGQSSISYSSTHAFISAPNGGALQDLGTFGGSISSAIGVNNSGQVVGYATITGDAFQHAFISAPNGGTLRDLGTLGGTSIYTNSWAHGINSSGQVAGYADTGNGNGTQHAFISTSNGGPLRDLGTLGGPYSVANGINNSGQVVGIAYTSGNNAPGHAFISAPNGGALQDLGTLGGLESTATGINDSGQVVGYAYTTGNAYWHAFISAPNGGALQDLGTLGGSASTAKGINNSGQVVGYSQTTGDAAQHPFLYTGTAMVDLAMLTGNSSGLFYATGINDFAQISVNSSYHGFLLTLHPSWQASGSGAWDNPSNWNFGGAGALAGLTPGRPHDVAIEGTTAANVAGPSANTQVNSLTLGGVDGAAVALNLGSGTLLVNNGVTINPRGILGGNGILQGTVTNAGQIQVTGGNRLQLTGDGTTNSGTISVLGSTANPAELDHAWALNNNSGGRLILQNALYRGGGLTNAGLVAVTGTANNIFGTIDQQAGGQFILSGNSNTTFYDTFQNNGVLKVASGSTATFFGLVTGAGSYAGNGTSFYEGTFHVGNSPAIVTIDNPTVYDSSSILSMDLAGITPGGCTLTDCAHYAQINFNNDVQFNGGILKIDLYNGFTPEANLIFSLFNFNSTHSGSFSSLLLPTLGNGLVWNTSDLYLNGQLSVAAVPLPASAWLMGSALAVLVGYARKSTRGAGASGLERDLT